MDDATITQPEESGLYPSGRYPSVVTTDDLVFELGKSVIERRNHEKLLESLLKKSQRADAEVATMHAEMSQVLKDCESIKASNVSYETTNRKLSDELVVVRNALLEKDRQLASLTATLASERNAWAAEKAQMRAVQDTLREDNARIVYEHEQKLTRELERTKKRVVRKALKKNG